MKIGHLVVYILHSKREKFPTIIVSSQNLLNRLNLTWFTLYFGLHPLFEPETKKRIFFKILSTFFNEIYLKLWYLIGYHKKKWYFGEKISNSDFFRMYGLSSKRGKLEKIQFEWSIWCYFEHLPNRPGISNFGRAEMMYVDAQFSKPFGSNYFQWWEYPNKSFKTRSRGLTSADPWKRL